MRVDARGYTANASAVDGNQGFAQAAGNGELAQDRIDRLAGEWATPKTLFKFHAACHLTHAGIEATSSILAGGVRPESIEQITMTVGFPIRPTGCRRSSACAERSRCW